MKVAVYMPEYNETHQEVLEALADGIPGAKLRWLSEFTADTDVAVVFGWFKYAYIPTMRKRPIIENYLPRGRLIVVESAFLKRKQYYQVGWNGFAGYADFKNEGVPMDRWNALDIETQPWTKKNDGLVVVCGQLPRDTQVQDVDHLAWCRETFQWADKRFGERAVFRPHPRHKVPWEYGIDPSRWDERRLQDVFADASLIVTYNSTTGVEAAVAGVPVIALDRGSMAGPVACDELLESAQAWKPDRSQWLAGIGYAQWTLEE
ncbi:MAG: hypothetical protein GWN10_13350, partial [Nitrospinaceae bacterium]|nr:hypothetical protein [Nitrospinaceae bacterium]NIR55605.1 hypothetical protein [Nitrospinaceae bacterium]NIT82882.1 hypothetical protein [Nitrospinaceae bacterium]NIW06670.1 hypothetical protein [Nitrospinaceae bacterium]NIX35235.1 hypothetical protein [Nitrospinaceae bacterium]